MNNLLKDGSIISCSSPRNKATLHKTNQVIKKRPQSTNKALEINL